MSYTEKTEIPHLRSVEPTRKPVERMNFPDKLEGEWKIICLEPGTCCDRASRRFADKAFCVPPQLIPVGSFIAARDRARQESDSMLLLPCVHEVFAQLYPSPRWELIVDFWFHLDNPPIYLARAQTMPAREDNVCATVSRLRPLVEISDARFPHEFLEVPTTQAAARAVAEEGRCGYCITNQHGVQAYGLKIVEELKCMTMGWYPFRYRGAGQCLQPVDPRGENE